jgi:hypothetical protein
MVMAIANSCHSRLLYLTGHFSTLQFHPYISCGPFIPTLSPMHNHHTILGIVRTFNLPRQEWIVNSQNCTLCEIHGSSSTSVFVPGCSQTQATSSRGTVLYLVYVLQALLKLPFFPHHLDWLL